MEDAEIWYRVADKPSEVQWSLVFSAGAGPLFDTAEIRVKSASANQDVFPKVIVLTKQTLSNKSGPPLKAPVWGSNGTANWDYKVVAVKNKVDVASLDPRVIIRK